MEDNYKLLRHIEDIAEAQDEMTKALITIYRDIKKIANHLNIKLDKPLINMNLEKGSLSAFEKNIYDAEIEDNTEVISWNQCQEKEDKKIK